MSGEFEDLDLFRVAKVGDRLKGDPNGSLTEKGAQALNEQKRGILEGRKIPSKMLVTLGIISDNELSADDRENLLKRLHGDFS